MIYVIKSLFYKHNELMTEAQYYKSKNRIVTCNLCPHKCKINPGKSGVCNVRTNHDGMLISDAHQKVSSLNLDPIEKKPLYHFFPGQKIFSIGSVGCNLKCKFCQNWEISQEFNTDFPYLKEYTSREIVDIAKSHKNNIGIAFTYNEPTVWYEYMISIAKRSKLLDMKNVVVSNGYINKEPLNELLDYIDAFNIDLKAFTEDFYKKQTSSSLKPVLKTIKRIAKSNSHLEITNLIIPDLNDDINKFEEMVKWISNEAGENTALHISRYFPMYKMGREATPILKLLELFEIAKEYLNFVYIGNTSINDGNNTHCFACNNVVINRMGYHTLLSGISNEGDCIYCGTNIINEKRM